MDYVNYHLVFYILIFRFIEGGTCTMKYVVNSEQGESANYHNVSNLVSSTSANMAWYLWQSTKYCLWMHSIAGQKTLKQGYITNWQQLITWEQSFVDFILYVIAQEIVSVPQTHVLYTVSQESSVSIFVEMHTLFKFKCMYSWHNNLVLCCFTLPHYFFFFFGVWEWVTFTSKLACV